MAYKKIEVNNVPIWNATVKGVWQLEDGDEIEGIYRGVKENVGDNNSKLYTIEANRGKYKGLYKIWGSIVLDDKMDVVNIGDQIKIVYLGKVKSEKGGRSYHNYDLYIDEDAKNIDIDDIDEVDDDLPIMDN